MLNRVGQAEAVVAQFESGRVAFSEAALGEYVKALAKLDRLDNGRVLSLMQVCVCGGANAEGRAGGGLCVLIICV